MPLFDYQCENNHIVEKLQKQPTESELCPICGEKALRKLSTATVKLEGWSGSFPGAAMKWDRIHRQMGKKKE